MGEAKGEGQCGGAGVTSVTTQRARGNPGCPELPLLFPLIRDADADQKTIGILVPPENSCLEPALDLD